MQFADRYAAEQILWIVTKSVGSASPQFLQKLQDLITKCEQNNLKNASISHDEDLISFSDIISSATSSAEVDNCIDSIISS